METGALGKVYKDEQVVFRQGEEGHCMYVVQAGQVEATQELDGKPIRIALLTEGDVFGEMALFDGELRSATVRSLGESRVLTVDKRTLDPALAFALLQKMSVRIRALNSEALRWKRSGNPIYDLLLNSSESKTENPKPEPRRTYETSR